MVEFTLPDAAGVSHNYVVAKIPFGVNVRFARALLARAVQPLARLAMAQDSAQAAAMAKTDADDTASLLDLLDGMDIEGLAGDVGDVIANMDVDVLLALFNYVQRDGIPLDTDGTRSKAYDQNWPEFYRACFELVKGQGYLAFSVTSSKT